MIIDLKDGSGWEGCRYESDLCPRIGDTITLLSQIGELCAFSATVLSCDHLIGRTVGADIASEKLVTCTVKRKW